MHIKDPLIKIDIYISVWSDYHDRALTSGEEDVEVPESEAKPWLGNYALLSSEREEEDAKRKPKTPRRNPSKKRHERTGPGDGDVGD